MSETERDEILRWIRERRGRYCLLRIAAPENEFVAALRGHIGDHDTGRADAPDFFAVDDGRSAIGIGQPGFAVPAAVSSAMVIDDHGIVFTSDQGLTTRLILAASDQ